MAPYRRRGEAEAASQIVGRGRPVLQDGAGHTAPRRRVLSLLLSFGHSGVHSQYRLGFHNTILTLFGRALNLGTLARPDRGRQAFHQVALFGIYDTAS
jgi:hypothetical protein